jgi:hypothetical protein
MKTKFTDPAEVAVAIAAVPPTLAQDELEAFLLAVLMSRLPDPRETLSLILSMSMTCCRVYGIGFDTLAEMFEAVAAKLRDGTISEEELKWRSN